MKILECKKLSIGYNEKAICKDINFEVNSGDCLCIIGENGSGKSTLLKTILGLNKQISGKVIYEKTFNKKNIGYLPQQSEFQKDFPATVKEVIMSGFVNKMGFRPFYNKIEKQKANEIINFLGINDYQKKSYRDLSGGQQQRVLLARALCATDNFLVLDEPTNGLDARAIKKFYDLIFTLNQKGMTIIMISHDIEKVLNCASHILYLKDTLVFYGSKEEFIQSKLVQNFRSEAEN